MSPIHQHKRDLRTAADLDRDAIDAILERSLRMKEGLRRGGHEPHLAGKSLAMIFEKPSLRTRCTFEIGMFQLGGHAVYLGAAEIGLGKRESIHDVGRNLERWFDLVTARTFAQATVDGLAEHCRIPVINALSDAEHPCQAMADVMTLREKVGDLKGFNLTYIGDGNNICHSLMIIGARLGMNVTVSSPEGYEPGAAAARLAAAEAARHGGSYRFERDPRAAVERAQAVYTDVWASMGQEHEAEARAKLFAPWQVSAALMAAAPAGAFVMHDLPAHRGEEITDEVLDSPASIVFDQAENRLHAQKGIMVYLWEARR
ncbi:MAG: ornithine carbamoyltransferase [bacterium]|nr:ornithine carbamoyltransferase [bacterium]